LTPLSPDRTANLHQCATESKDCIDPAERLRSQHRARRLPIRRDLGLELLEARKFHFRPDEVDQRDAQRLAVEIV